MENSNKTHKDLEKAINFLNERIKLAQANMRIPDRDTSPYKEEIEMYLQIGNHLKELLRYRNNAPTLLLDLAELPKGYTLEDFLTHYRNDGVLIIDTFDNNPNHQVNTRLL